MAPRATLLYLHRQHTPSNTNSAIPAAVVLYVLLGGEDRQREGVYFSDIVSLGKVLRGSGWGNTGWWWEGITLKRRKKSGGVRDKMS